MKPLKKSRLSLPDIRVGMAADPELPDLEITKPIADSEDHDTETSSDGSKNNDFDSLQSLPNRMYAPGVVYTNKDPLSIYIMGSFHCGRCIKFDISSGKYETDLVASYPDDNSLPEDMAVCIEDNSPHIIIYSIGAGFFAEKKHMLIYHFKDNSWKSMAPTQMKSFGFGCKAAIVYNSHTHQSELHATTYNNHWLWDTKKEEFTKVSTLPQNFVSNALVYVRSKQLLLLFGGNGSNNYDSIYYFDLTIKSKSHWSLLSGSVYTYKSEWQRYNSLTLPYYRMWNFGYYLVNDTYLFLFGGGYQNKKQSFADNDSDSPTNNDHDILISNIDNVRRRIKRANSEPGAPSATLLKALQRRHNHVSTPISTVEEEKEPTFNFSSSLSDCNPQMNSRASVENNIAVDNDDDRGTTHSDKELTEPRISNQIWFCNLRDNQPQWERSKARLPQPLQSMGVVYTSEHCFHIIGGLNKNEQPCRYHYRINIQNILGYPYIDIQPIPTPLRTISMPLLKPTAIPVRSMLKQLRDENTQLKAHLKQKSDALLRFNNIESDLEYKSFQIEQSNNILERVTGENLKLRKMLKEQTRSNKQLSVENAQLKTRIQVLEQQLNGK